MLKQTLVLLKGKNLLKNVKLELPFEESVLTARAHLQLITLLSLCANNKHYSLIFCMYEH
jgi:hypothetical protein